MKFSGTFFVLRKDDVNLRIGRHGDDNAAVGIQIHPLRIPSCAYVLGDPLSQHVILGERRVAIVAGYFSEDRTESRPSPHKEILPGVLSEDVPFDRTEIEPGADGVDLLSRP